MEIHVRIVLDTVLCSEYTLSHTLSPSVKKKKKKMQSYTQKSTTVKHTHTHTNKSRITFKKKSMHRKIVYSYTYIVTNQLRQQRTSAWYKNNVYPPPPYTVSRSNSL